ncbi:hypothetical protein ACFQO4_20770 [Saliphagus sp. GCM10025334]
MSDNDRVSEQCLPALDALREIETDTEDQGAAIEKALELVEWVIEDDKGRNGPGPTDALIAHIENTDECPACGKPIEKGGWCSLSCMQDHLGEGESA